MIFKIRSLLRSLVEWVSLIGFCALIIGFIVWGVYKLWHHEWCIQDAIACMTAFLGSCLADWIYMQPKKKVKPEV